MTRRPWVWLMAAVAVLLLVATLGCRSGGPPVDWGTPPEVTLIGETP